MKVRILSDLHLENHPISLEYAGEDVLILAGDIYSGKNTVKMIKQLTIPETTEILFVPGNHEYYAQTSMKDLNAQFKRECKGTNIHLLDNTVLTFNSEKVRFIGTTLWTQFEWKDHSEDRIEYNMNHAKRNINDFFVIYTDKDIRYTVQDCRKLAQKNIRFIKRKLKEPFDGKTVVITHFPPFLESIHEKYQGDAINPYFCNDLEELAGKMDIWVHGHMHSPFDYIKNGTRVICNPRGYWNEHGFGYDENLIIEV